MALFGPTRPLSALILFKKKKKRLDPICPTLIEMISLTDYHDEKNKRPLICNSQNTDSLSEEDF